MNTNRHDAGVTLATDYVTDREPGRIVVHDVSNSFSVSAVSFYAAARDPNMRYSVGWYENVEESRWVLSRSRTTRAEFVLVKRLERDGTVYVYKRVE